MTYQEIESTECESVPVDASGRSDSRPEGTPAAGADSVSPKGQSLSKIIQGNLERLIHPGQVFEVRALNCRNAHGNGRPHTRRGYFDYDHIEEAAEAAAKLTKSTGKGGWGAEGVYFTLNPLSPDLLSRCSNRVEFSKDGEAAEDSHVTRRCWLLIDVDPVRISGVSSSGSEMESARLVGQRVVETLSKDNAFPDPAAIANSGNGWHILYQIDMPNDDHSRELIKSFLKSLNQVFGSEKVSVDTKVFNASRICKLYGTFARKGDHTEARPHRPSAIIRSTESTEILLPGAMLEFVRKNPIDDRERNGVLRPRQTMGSSPSVARRSGGMTVFERARKYAASADPAISGQGGHSVAYRLACEMVRGFDLPRPQALEILSEWNERCEPPWTEAELLHKIEQAEKYAEGEPGYQLNDNRQSDRLSKAAVDAAEFDLTGFGADQSEERSTVTPKLTASAPIMNYREQFTEKGERLTSPVSLPDIAARMISQLWTDHGIELIRDGSGLIAVWNGTAKRLENQNSFFAFLGYVTGFPPDFKESQGYHSRAEVFAHFLNFSPEFESVTDTPHHPRIETIRYLKEDPPGHGGEYLSQFMQRFNFATSADYDLFQSILMTPFWGGRPGSRPGSVFTPETESLRGTGKTKAMESIAELAGGSIDYGETGDEAKLTTRALSESASGKRLIIGDNVKGSAISGSGKEKLITTRRWSGHRMYKGEGSIENRFLWIFTMNGFRAGRDMAQRLIEVRFRKPERYIATWEDDLDSLLQQHRWKIIGDVLELLRGPKCPPDKLSRFAGWDAEVLGCVADPNEAQAVRFERQDACDADAEEGSEIEAIVFRKLIALGYAADVDGVFIPSRILAEWVNHSEGSKVSTTGISRKLTGLIGEKIVTKLRVRKSHSAGRGFDWIPDRWDRITVHTDIEDRRSSMSRSRESLGTDGTVQDVFGTDVAF